MPELTSLPEKPSVGPEPELDLLLHNQTLEEPIWKSLFRNIDEFFFPKKLPPLVLTSKPIPVRDIWGFYNYKGKGAVGSTVVHIVAIALIIVGTIIAQRAVKEIVKPKETVELIAPSDMPTLEPSRTVSGGGGGGGDRDKLQASAGRLPRQSMQQLAPPVVVVRNEHPLLPVEPTVVIPPEVHIQQPNLPNLGDPLSHMPASVPSNGTGSGGGIGSGNGGGVGSGEGPGFGPGHGGGTGGGAFRVGGGVSAPKAVPW